MMSGRDGGISLFTRLQSETGDEEDEDLNRFLALTSSSSRWGSRRERNSNDDDGKIGNDSHLFNNAHMTTSTTTTNDDFVWAGERMRITSAATATTTSSLFHFQEVSEMEVENSLEVIAQLELIFSWNCKILYGL
jgi:hypothetical protein